MSSNSHKLNCFYLFFFCVCVNLNAKLATFFHHCNGNMRDNENVETCFRVYVNPCCFGQNLFFHFFKNTFDFVRVHGKNSLHNTQKQVLFRETTFDFLYFLAIAAAKTFKHFLPEFTRKMEKM